MGNGVARGRVWYPVKVHHNGHNVSIITETLSLSVYEPIAKQLARGRVPQIGGGVELGGRLRYPRKSSVLGKNVFAGTETLSLSVYESIAIQCCSGGPVPQIGEWVELGVRVRYPAKDLRVRYNFLAGTETLSLSVYEPIAM